MTNYINCVRKFLVDNHTDLNMQIKEGKAPVYFAVSHHFLQKSEIMMERDGNIGNGDGDITSDRMLLNSTSHGK